MKELNFVIKVAGVAEPERERERVTLANNLYIELSEQVKDGLLYFYVKIRRS